MRSTRKIAISVVLCATLGSIAYGDFVATETPTNANPGGSNFTMRTIVSLRNNSPGVVMATLDKVPALTDPCPQQAASRIDGTPAKMGSMNTVFTFGSGEQHQFIVSGVYAMTGTHSCNWSMNGGGSNTGAFRADFDVGSGIPAGLNITPHVFDFRVPGTSETQTAFVQNYGPTASSYMQVFITGGNNTLKIDGPSCFNMPSCPGVTVQGGTYEPVNFKCTPMTTPQSGTITFMIGASFVVQVPFTCAKFGMPVTIDIPASMTLQGPAAMPISVPVPVTGSGDSLEDAMIVGGDATAFTITQPNPPCTGTQSCLWTPPASLVNSVSLTVQCTPGTTQKTSTLRVKGGNHINDIDTMDLSCVADSGAATSESVLDFGDVKVTTTSLGKTFDIQNLSSSAPVSVTVDTGHPDWIADSCVTAPCTIGPSSFKTVDVKFKPSVPARNDRTLGVFVGGTQVSGVDLKGNGVGSRMRVTSQMSPYLIDFGTIGLSATRTRNVKLKADGNRNLTVGVGMPAAPFTRSKVALDLAPGAEDDFDITCQSMSPGTFNSSVTLMPGPAMNVYAQDTDKLDVRCKVANTPVQVMPDELDFGEVRRNTPPPTMDITIFNPSGATISLDYVRLASPGGSLSLVPPIESSLGPGAMLHATLTLSTTVETEIANALEVGVGGEQLVTPITGSVVTASARVTPTSLRLGSVCLNAEVDEPVKMVNNGTARLHAKPPMMNTPFAVLFVNPINYPDEGALLAPGEEATASVRLATATPQTIMGELNWDVDAPDAPFTIKASVEVKNTGTAVSPQEIVFDQIPADTRSNRRSIRLENCGTEQTQIAVKGVVSSKGAVGAWEVMPSTLDETLGPNDKRTIEVTFAPKRGGHYEARIVLTVDGVMQFIDLFGDAVGDDVERTSLYACSCSAPGGSPLPMVPLVLVVVCVIFRRRTGSS